MIPDTGDTIASYTFDFDDGSATVTQSTPTVSHTYNAANNYGAHLSVTDSRGLASTNTAEVTIMVVPAGVSEITETTATCSSASVPVLPQASAPCSTASVRGRLSRPTRVGSSTG